MIVRISFIRPLRSELSADEYWSNLFGDPDTYKKYPGVKDTRANSVDWSFGSFEVEDPEVAFGLGLEITGSTWGRSYSARAYADDGYQELPLACMMFERIQKLATAAREADKELKKTRPVKNKLWHRNVATARRLLRSAL